MNTEMLIHTIKTVDGCLKFSSRSQSLLQGVSTNTRRAKLMDCCMRCKQNFRRICKYHV